MPPPPPPSRGWETKFSQNFWASTGMTQNFLAVSAKSAKKSYKSYQKGRVFFRPSFGGFF